MPYVVFPTSNVVFPASNVFFGVFGKGSAILVLRKS